MEKIITKVCQTILWLTTSVIFFILCANTLMRYALGKGLDWSNEVPEMLFPWLVVSGVVLAAVQGSHITTSFLRDRLKPGHQRWLAALVWAVVAALYATLCIATWRMLPIVHDEKSPILGVPASVTFSSVLLGMFCLMVLALKYFVTTLKTPAAEIAQANAAATPNTHY